MYSHVSIVYHIFAVINIAVLLWSGVMIARTKTDRGFWRYAWAAIIVYTLFMGLRFGRHIDYNGYAVTYRYMAKDLSYGDYEPLFRGIIYVFTSLGLHFQFFIIFCAFMLIYSMMFFLKDYKPAMPFMLLLFLWESTMAENLIRWYLAIAFFLIYVYFLRKGNPFLYLFGLAAIGCHFGTLILVLAVFFLSKVKIVPLPPYVWQILLIASVFLGTTEILSSLSPYISLLGIDERTAKYAEQYDDILAGEFGHVGMRERAGFITLARTIIGYSFPIWMISALIKDKIITPLDANCYLIGIVANPICKQVEILERFSSGFLLFALIVAGCSYWYVFKNAKNYNIIIRLFAALSLFCYAWPIFSGLFYRTEWWQMLFIWDAHGRESIPYGFYQGLLNK